MFESAKVGDRVWSMLNGWGTITHIADTGNWFDVQFDSEPSRSDENNHYLNGKRSSGDENPTLFWDEIHFDIPPKPKKLVKKTVEGWARTSLVNSNTTFFNQDKSEVTHGVSNKCKPYKATLTYEIEE